MKMIQNNGIHKTYYENGQLESESNYKNGKHNGVSKSYYENGKEVSSKLFNQNGKLEFDDTNNDDTVNSSNKTSSYIFAAIIIVLIALIRWIKFTVN